MTTRTICEIAGEVVEGKERPGFFQLMDDLSLCTERNDITKYVASDFVVADFNNIAFMFACFTLLLNDDDSF